jgi:hypothetical protein
MRRSRSLTLIAPLAVTLALTAGAALAHGRGGPCRHDVETLCPDITPGPESFRDCLQQHADAISPACKEHVSQMQAKMAAWRQACEADVQTHCSDVAPGPRNIGKCLHQHFDELSKPCKDQLSQHWHHRHHHHPEATPGADSDNS